LTRQEPLDPNLPICDPHHHLWDYPDDFPGVCITASLRHIRGYLLQGLWDDTSGDHNIQETVFIECRSMYRKDRPEELKPIGETEFVRSIPCKRY